MMSEKRMLIPIMVLSMLLIAATGAKAADLSGEWLMHWDSTPNGSVDPEPNNTEPRLLIKEGDPGTYKGSYTNMDNPAHFIVRSIGPSATAPIVMEQNGSLSTPNVTYWCAYSGRILADGSIKGFWIDDAGRQGDFTLTRPPKSE